MPRGPPLLPRAPDAFLQCCAKSRQSATNRSRLPSPQGILAPVGTTTGEKISTGQQRARLHNILELDTIYFRLSCCHIRKEYSPCMFF